MAAAPSFRRGEVIARRYQVVTKSGETALWVGYHAVDQGSVSHPAAVERGAIPEPDVLVKVVKPELIPEPAMREKLVRDLGRMKGLQHPGMPRLNDVQLLEEHNTVVLIEAIQAGLSQGVLLRRMATFRQKERFPLAEVRQIGAQLASALSYIHGQMLCHGDLRLESVLLRPDGAKLCDIGLGAALPRNIYLEAVKKVGEFDLLSPEVRAGRQPDPRADVFGLAALYRHLLSIGQGSGWEALIAEKPAMAVVLTRGMHEDPAQRYSSIEALIADIEAVALTGAPIRRRLAPTPLAMAVAAGRLPVEDLQRPMEDLVPESARSRRNSGIFEVGAVLAPLSGAPSAKMSIGTIPPQLSGPSSARSGRILDGTASDSNPPMPAREARGPTSATSRGPTSNTSRGPASGISRGGERPSSYSLPPVTEAGEAVKAVPRGKDAEPGSGPTTPTAVKEPVASEAGAAVPTGIAGPGDETTPYLKNRPAREGSTTIPPVAAAAAEPAPKAAPPAEFAAKAVPQELGGEEGRSGRRTLSGKTAEKTAEKVAEKATTEKAAEGRSEPIPRRQATEISKSEGREPSSARSTNSARSRAEQASQRSRSGDSGRQSTASITLASKALISSRLALVGALGLAALIGALVAVVLMLLIRPVSLCGPAPLPPPALPVKELAPTQVEPVPVVPTPVVPIEVPPNSAPAAVPNAPAVAPSVPAVVPSAPAVVPSAPVVAPSAPVVAPSAPVVAPNAPVVVPSAPPNEPLPAAPAAGPATGGTPRPTPPLRLAGPATPPKLNPGDSAPVIPQEIPVVVPVPPTAAGPARPRSAAKAPSPKKPLAAPIY